jgi:hypothetical protein
MRGPDAVAVVTTDRAGEALARGMFVAVLPYNTRENATVEEARSLGAEFYGTVLSVDNGYVKVLAADAMRGTVEVRANLVLYSK